MVIKVLRVQKFGGQGTEGISCRSAGDMVRPRSDRAHTQPACMFLLGFLAWMV